MGADLCLTSLPIEEGKTPDWDAARQTLDAMSDEALLELSDVLRSVEHGERTDEAADIRTALATAIERVEAVIGGEWSRELAEIRVTGWTIYATGGMSYGDGPSDLFDYFEDLWASGLASAAGFAV